MNFKLLSLKLDEGQHPGCHTLKLTAQAEAEDGGKVMINVKAEPEHSWKPGFTVRMESWNAGNRQARDKYGVRGLNAVEGLAKQARALAREFWNKPVVPDTPPDSEALRKSGNLDWLVDKSTTLKLILENMEILGTPYSGELVYHASEKTGELYYSHNRFNSSVHIPVTPQDKATPYCRVTGMNNHVVQAIGEWLLPVAQDCWKAERVIILQLRVKELKDAVAFEAHNITSHENALTAARANMKGLLEELGKVETTLQESNTQGGGQSEGQ